MKKGHLIVILTLLFLMGAFVRLTPHPMNFTPVFALALFAGTYLPRKWSVSLPLSVMFLTDLFLGFYEPGVMASVYGSIALTGLAGCWLRKRKNVFNLLTLSLGASLFFFLSTNFAVWALSDWYAHTWQGLLLNYTLAVPFFRNTLLGNLFFSGILFGSYELVRLKYKSKLEAVSAESRNS